MNRFARINSVTAALIISVSMGVSAHATGFVTFDSIEGEALDQHHQGQANILAWSPGAEVASVARPRRTDIDDAEAKCSDAGSEELTVQCVQRNMRKQRFELHERTPEAHYRLGRLPR